MLASVAVCLLFLSQPSLASEALDYLDDSPSEVDGVPLWLGDDSGATMPLWKLEVKPQPISIPEAEYPERARKAGIEGRTVVEALIDTNGLVADVRVLMPSGNADLDLAAAAAAREAKFRPGMQRGVPVRVWVSLPFRFRLDDGKKTDRPAPKGIFVRDDGEVLPPFPPPPVQAPGLDSALADLARKLVDGSHGESLPRLAVTPFEQLSGSVGDTGVYIAEVLEMQLAGSGRCRVVEREAVAQLLGVAAPTRAAVMDTAARRNLVRVFRLSGIVAGTFTHMDGGMKLMARVVNPRTGLITRTGEVRIVGPRPQGRPRPPVPPPPAPELPKGVTRFEGENLKLKNITAGTYEVQPYTFGGQWSGGRQSWWWGAHPGDRLDLHLPVTPGRYRVTAQFCKSHDYGIVQLLIDGKKVGKPIDFYADRAIVSGPMDLGIHTFGPGTHVLSAVLKGANPKMHLRGDDRSGGKILYLFAVDYLDLIEQGK